MLIRLGKVPKRESNLCQEPSPPWWCQGMGETGSPSSDIISFTHWFKGAQSCCQGLLITEENHSSCFLPREQLFSLSEWPACSFHHHRPGVASDPGPVPACPCLPLGRLHFPVKPSHCAGPHLCALPRLGGSLEGESIALAVFLKSLYRELYLTN